MMQPNILLMISHDSGRKFQNYGYRVATPHINALAQRGLQFDNCYCPAPQCSPSRGALLTGLYPHNNGLIGLAHLGFCISEGVTTLPKELQKNGYYTALIGLSHETINNAQPVAERIFSSTTALGYDDYIPVPGERASQVADSVIDFLLRHQHDDRPFYLNAGFFETHRDFDEYQPVADRPDEVEVFDFLPDVEAVRQDIALFNGALKMLDSAVGRICAALDATGLGDNTIVVFTTDHGVAFPLAKGTLKTAGLETALIIVLPGKAAVTGRRQALLCNIDLMPTLLELIGAACPDGLDGKSFASLLQSPCDEGRESFFTELTWHDKYHPMRGVRTARYSYVKNFADGPLVYVPVDAHLSLSGLAVRERLYVPNEPEELYDLHLDPLEKNNLIAHPDYQAIAARLRERVANWMRETDDPLLSGPVKGVESRRWAQEIAAGRAYPGREKWQKQMKSPEGDDRSG